MSAELKKNMLQAAIDGLTTAARKAEPPLRGLSTFAAKPRPPAGSAGFAQDRRDMVAHGSLVSVAEGAVLDRTVQLVSVLYKIGALDKVNRPETKREVRLSETHFLSSASDGYARIRNDGSDSDAEPRDVFQEAEHIDVVLATVAASLKDLIDTGKIHLTPATESAIDALGSAAASLREARGGHRDPNPGAHSVR